MFRKNIETVSNDELIEEWDWESGTPTGRAVSRKKAHREGIPHEGVHLWIFAKYNNKEYILLQRRAPYKEFYPNVLDISVGGHVVYNQTEDKLEKETFEELGFIPDKEKLIDLGYFRYDETIPEMNLVHREFQRVWLLFDNRPLNEYHFNDGEVDGLAAVEYNEFKGILSGSIRANGFFYDGIDTIEKEFVRKEFHPLFFTGPMAEYMKRLMKNVDKDA